MLRNQLSACLSWNVDPNRKIFATDQMEFN